MSCSQCVYWDGDATPVECYGVCSLAKFIGLGDHKALMLTQGSPLLTRCNHVCGSMTESLFSLCTTCVWNPLTCHCERETVGNSDIVIKCEGHKEKYK